MPPSDPSASINPEPQHAFAISLNHVMERFNAEGIGRTKRRLAELCQKGTLEGRKFKTTHGDTWFVTAASLEAAVQQIKSEESLAAAAGASMLEHATAGDSQRSPAASTPGQNQSAPPKADEPAQPSSSIPHRAEAGGSQLQHAPAGYGRVEQGSDLAVYDHPYIKRLEAKVDKLEDKLYETQTAHRQELMELQKANLVAISQNFGKYMLEMIGMKTTPTSFQSTSIEEKEESGNDPIN